MHNTFGERFRIEIEGASHAPSLHLRIWGVPQGVSLCEHDFECDLARRRAGAKGTTPRHERDIPHIVSGVEQGVTTGDVIDVVFYNEDVRSSDYDRFVAHPRPSHVDFAARAKYGEAIDLRGSGIFSGRMTVPNVCCRR